MDEPRSAVPDVLAANLRLLLVGINPGRASAAAAAHFANPRNDFWRLLHASGLTPRELTPREQHALLGLGIGITNAALRTTPGSGDLRAARLRRRVQPPRADRRRAAAGGHRVRRQGGVPRGVPGAGRARRPAAPLGEARLFVLPSTSPANAAVPWTERLHWFRELAAFVDEIAGSRRALRWRRTTGGTDDRAAGPARHGRRDRGRRRPHVRLGVVGDPGRAVAQPAAVVRDLPRRVRRAAARCGSCSPRSRPPARCCSSRSASRSSSRGSINRGMGSLYLGAIITALAAPDLLAAAGVVPGPGVGTACLGVAFLFIAAVRALSGAGGAGRRRWARSCSRSAPRTSRSRAYPT